MDVTTAEDTNAICAYCGRLKMNCICNSTASDTTTIEDEHFWARQRKLLEEKDKFISFDII
jgi:hypothetical protein